ncbi:unnamed protein product [Nezara viridula]|uniref:Uncharacterized protein n=1 Tax=Nezara viridula TaxID=85310 RepID=A0A9P0H2K9_NEZVI|nr:unnamed protein product [Nezara viridula]
MSTLVYLLLGANTVYVPKFNILLLLLSFKRMSRPQKRRFQSDDEKKEKYNSTISSSIADIIRFSLDDQFRLKCFQLMQVDNTNDFQLAIKDKLDSLINPSSNTSHTLQKRPSFHDEEPERSLICPDRNGIIPQVNIEKQTDEVTDKELTTIMSSDIYSSNIINKEIPNSLTQNITDSHIDEIAKVLKMTNIVVEENIEDKDSLPATSRAASKTLIETEEIKKGITLHNVNCNEDELAEKIDGFWPTEECCLWDPNNAEENGAILLQEEIDDIDLNENDTDWQ